MIESTRSLPLEMRWDWHHNINIDSRQSEVSDFQVWYGDSNGVEVIDNLWTTEDEELFFNGEAGQEEVDQTPKNIYGLLTKMEGFKNEPSISSLLGPLDVTGELTDGKICPVICQVALNLVDLLMSFFFEHFVAADIPKVHRPEFLRRYLYGKSTESKMVKTKNNASLKLDNPLSRDILFDFFSAIAESMAGAILPITSSLDISTSSAVSNTMMLIIGALDHLYHQNKLGSTLSTKRSNSWKQKMEYHAALKSGSRRGSFINHALKSASKRSSFVNSDNSLRRNA